MPRTVVLITGGDGLVGSALKWAISNFDKDLRQQSDEHWVFVKRTDCDLICPKATEALFAAHKPQYVIHLAARTGGNQLQTRKPVNFLRENSLIDFNVLEMAQRFKVRKLIACCSTCAFGPDSGEPMDESSLYTNRLHDSNYAYATAKRSLGVLAKAYNQQLGCNFIIIIPTNVFGPNDKYGSSSHVIPGLIRKSFASKETGNKLVVAGTGDAKRQFVYSLDVANIILVILRRYTLVDPLIISGPPETEISIKDLAQQIASSVGFEGSIMYDELKENGPVSKTVSNGKLQQFLDEVYPKFVFTPLDKALRESVHWYKSNRAKSRL